MIKDLLKISFDDEGDKYDIHIPQGSSVQETAFGVAAMIRCLVRDKIIKNDVEFLELLAKYLDDPQYDEVKKDE